ncbi:hypothetical protein V8E51_016408 [Hyaloscypha variabilis]
MEAIGLVASVIAIVQISGACLKLSLKPLGPSSYKPERLQSLSTTLYGFNGNIRNLQTLLEIYEDDQARLDTLNHLQEPLTKCHEALQLLNSRLQSDGFFAQYIMGSKFDKKFELCLRVLNDAKDLLELSLQCDQRILISAVESYIRNVAEDTRDIKAAIKQNEQLIQTMDTGIKQYSDLAMRLHDEHTQSVARLESSIRDVHIDIESQEVEGRLREQLRHRSLVLNWLSNVDFRSNYLDALRKREAGTGQWLIDQELFRSWRDGPVRALWLNGMPGAGKTFLSTAVVDHLERTSTCPVVYFYFDFKDSVKQATESMMRSVAVQLETSLLHNKVSPALEQVYSNCQKTGSGRNPTLDEVTDLIIALSAFAPKFYIILDALDECQNREELLEAITTLKNSAVNAKLFVTSRQEQDIIECLTEDDFTPVTILEDSIKHDIGLYVSSILRNDIHLRRLPEELKRHIQNTLTAGAKSMQIDMIRPLKRPKIIKEALEKLPKTLDETYERILLRLSTEAEENLVQMRRIFAFVTFAKHPLTLAELAQAVVVEIWGKQFDEDAAFYDPKDLLCLCRPLIDISPSTGFLGFVHYSVQEFLLSERLSSAEGAVRMFALNERSCHLEIAEICLTFVSFDDFADGPCQTFNEFQDRKEKYPFLDYAAEHWPFHTEYKDVEAAVSDLLLRLLVPQKNAKLGSMLQACNDPNINCPRCGIWGTALMTAIRFGRQDIVDMLLELEIDVTVGGGRFYTALHTTAIMNDIHNMKRVIQLGANIDFGKDSWRPFVDTLPLSMAASVGRSRAFLYLIASGASLCNIPIERWVNELVCGRGYKGVSKEWALTFADELSSLGHYVEVVDLSKGLGSSELLEGERSKLERNSVPFYFRAKEPPV